MKIVKTFILVLAIVLFSPFNVRAQLRKTANIEKVKSFTNGSVFLYKAAKDSMSIYSVALRNNSKFHDNISFVLGGKEEMIKNLHDLSDALKDGKKGDVFDFSVLGETYNLSYDKVLGQVCFRISKPYSASTDYGRLYKATIDDIIAFLEKEGNNH